MAMGRLTKKIASIPVSADGSVRLAVVSDTHSRPHPAMATRLVELAPDAILHAGDIGDLTVLDDIAKFAPIYAVRGNIDEHARDLPDVLLLDIAGAAPLRHAAVHPSGSAHRSTFAPLGRGSEHDLGARRETALHDAARAALHARRTPRDAAVPGVPVAAAENVGGGRPGRGGALRGGSP